MTSDPPALPSPEPAPSMEPGGTPSPGPEAEDAAHPFAVTGEERGEGAAAPFTEAPPAAPSPRFTPRLVAEAAGVLLILALGAGGAVLWHQVAADEERLGAMREDLALLERKIEKETQPSAPVAAETEAKLTALEQRLAALEAKGETAAPGEASGSGESEAVAAALAERDARIAALEKEVAAVRDQVAGLREEIALLAARARLARALDEGRPLGTALALPPPLARFATTPPPTRQSLLKALDEAERAARSAPRPGEETAVPETGIAAELREAAAEAGRLFAAALTIRHGPTVVWGDPVAAATDAARDALRRDDLSAAIDAIAGIGGPAASFFTAWLDQARALHAAREALLSFGEGA